MGDDGLVYDVFRLVSAVVFTAVAVYVTRKMYLRQLQPVPVWLYTMAVLWVVTGFRWFVVWISCESGAMAAIVEPLIQPITQSMYLLLAMVIFVLTFTHIKERRRHFRLEHEEPEDG